MQKQYNRIWAVLLWAVLLTGCAEHTDAEPMLTETEQVTESTPIPETTETAALELTFKVQTDGVSFSLDGVFLQTISAENPPDTEDISICDYDSDGFPDVFIPESPHSFRGHYYRYDDAAEQLVLWNTLNFEKDGTGWYMEQNPDGTLCMDEYNIYGSRRTTYGWEQGELVPVRFMDQYWRHGSTVTDTYEYAQDGQKILVQREIRETDGNRSEIIEYPLYFRILPDTVQVLQNAEIVQELELGSFWESYAALGAYFEQQMESPTMPLEGAYLREPEQYLGTEDYDFDGHWDLYIPDTMQGECVGNYYRFSPETGRFEQWDELNAIVFEMYTDPENGTLNAYTGGEFRRWKWQDGGLVLTDEASR